MKPPRVLHILSQRPSWTGSGMALNALVAAAQRAGYQQHAIVGVPPDDPAPRIADMPRDRIHPLIFSVPELPFALPGMSDVMPYGSSRFSELSDTQLEQYGRYWTEHVQSVVRAFQPQVIHSHHVWILSSILKDIAPNTPVVTHCHATGLRQIKLCPHLAESVRKGCARNDAFAVLHRGHAVELSEQLSVPLDRIEIVGSGYRPEVFHSKGAESRNRWRIAYAGKLSNAKGLPQLLDVMHRLADRQPLARLQVAGTGAGAEADAIRERARGMSNVELLGQIDQPALADLFRRSSVFVLPSFYEGLPLVLVEAAACGCRIVATELPGIVEQMKPVLQQQLDCVALPTMATVDQPVAAELPLFVNRLEASLVAALDKPTAAGDTEAQLQDMSWPGVFRRIEAIWRRLCDTSLSSTQHPGEST